jgi:hypothetical protein
VEVSFSSKIRYKGGEYGSLEELPPDLRAPLQQALSRLTHGRTLQPRLCSRITINEREFNGVNEMPAEYRQLLEQSFYNLLPIDNAIALAAAREHAYALRGLAGLCTILAGLASAALYLWHCGYFN